MTTWRTTWLLSGGTPSGTEGIAPARSGPRAGAMQEALAQRNGIIGYFRALLQFNLQTDP